MSSWTLTTDSMACPAACIAQRRKRIGRLARLRDEQGRAARLEHGIAVAKLGRDIDVDRQAGATLEPIFGDHARVEGRAAGGDREPRELGEIEGKLRQVDVLVEST